MKVFAIASAQSTLTPDKLLPGRALAAFDAACARTRDRHGPRVRSGYRQPSPQPEKGTRVAHPGYLREGMNMPAMRVC